MSRVAGAVVATIVMLTGGLALAQQPRRGGGGSLPPWDPGTVTTVRGTVAGEREMGARQMVVVNLRTDAGPLTVVLGPQASLDPTLQKLAQGTEIEVTGSRVKRGGGGRQERELLISSVVKMGGKEYRLRDEQGNPIQTMPPAPGAAPAPVGTAPAPPPAGEQTPKP